MNNILKFIRNAFLSIALIIASLGMSDAIITPPDSNYPLGEPLAVAEKNLDWPEKQIFPSFSEPKDDLVAFPGDVLSHNEMVALSCLQGFVNAIETRVVILDSDVEKWLGDYGYNYNKVSRDDVFTYIAELCKGAVSGVVLYSDELSKEYINLASSIGNTMNAIPLEAEAYDAWCSNGVELPVVADIRGLTYTQAFDIYKYYFDNFWQNANHKILTVQRTDLAIQMRDLASAVGGAVIYLSCGGGNETLLFKKYLSDMAPGESILTGWYADQERELMTVAAQCGMSCVPSDFFSNATVFAQDYEIEVPAVPDMPELENKIYIAYFLSDGDNIQYDMHAMREFWDKNNSKKGQVNVNWTISPALVDIAPGMMNYYYSRATETECFVSGPSGMGYTMPKNTFGANRGLQFRSGNDFKAFVNMTNNYLQKAGLRAITIWDNLSLTHRNIYSNTGTYLYGLTVQHFTNASLKAMYTGVTNDMLIIQMTPAYFSKNAEGTTPITQIGNDIKDAVKYLKYKGSAPAFVATQANVWAFNNIDEVVYLEEYLSDYYEEIYGKDVVEFVRADHFYNLYYQAKNLPLDMTLKSELTATATSSSETAMLTTDGTCYGESIWQAETAGQQSVTYSLGETYKLSEINIYHAETNGLDSSLNSKAYKVEVSTDGESWKEVAEVSGNSEAWNNVTFKAVKGAYVRVTITQPGSDNISRIADIDIFGTLVK